MISADVEASPLKPLCHMWLDLIKKSGEHKDKMFGRIARECWQFYDADSHDFMYSNANESHGLYVDGSDGAEINTTFKMTMNKVAELVQLFGPTLYYRNPHRQVNARKPEIPDLAFQLMGDPNQAQMVQQQMMMNQQFDDARSKLLEWYLNYIPRETRLKEDSRKAIDEGLIKGRGVVWHEMYQPPESDLVMPRSTFDTVDNLFVDPDATSLDDAQWIARQRCKPTYQVEEEFGLEPGALADSASEESLAQAAKTDVSPNGGFHRKQGRTHDLVTYYEVWSKTGLGQHLKTNDLDTEYMEATRAISETLDQFGQYTYMVFAEGSDYPLNLPPDVMEMDIEEPGNLEELFRRIRWPIPFWADSESGWPVTELDFHPLPGFSWPQAHMKPALGELKFLNWAMSFLAGRIRITSRTFIAYKEQLEEEIKDAIENGGDLTMIPMKQQIHGRISEAVEFLNHPGVNKDIWDIVAAVMELFDKRTGLTELVYGQSGKQMRSASEAQMRNEAINVRPDDMAERVEEWQSRIARKEGMMARWFVNAQSIAPVFGEQYNPMMMQVGILTDLWQKLVFTPLRDEMGNFNLQAVQAVVREFEYSIEAGSVRKPNRDRDQANMDQALQTLYPPLLQYYQTTGDPNPLNAFIQDWGKTRDLDTSRYMLPVMQLQPPPVDPAMQGVA